MMEQLDEFSREKTTEKHSQAIMSIIKDIFSTGMKEFSKSISHLFQAPTGGKHQITNELARWEQQLIRKRSSQ